MLNQFKINNKHLHYKLKREIFKWIIYMMKKLFVNIELMQLKRFIIISQLKILNLINILHNQTCWAFSQLYQPQNEF